MSNVLAINQASKEAIERMEQEAMRDEFKHFIRNDVEVRQMMLKRVKDLIGGMSKWLSIVGNMLG